MKAVSPPLIFLGHPDETKFDSALHQCGGGRLVNWNVLRQALGVLVRTAKSSFKIEKGERARLDAVDVTFVF